MGFYPVSGSQSVSGNLTVSGSVTASGSLTAESVSANSLKATFGDIDISFPGTGIDVAEGTNARQGVVTLAAGTATVATSAVTSTSRIFLTVQSLGTVTTPSALAVTTLTAGTSFVITASQATDTSVVAWEIFRPG